jgi:transcriptional regulator with PAS, ATPase and Fis domain
MIKKGLMREDFFYRVHIIPITVPPLREHKEDIQLLIEYLFQKSKEKRKIETLPVKILEAMYKYDWPGNIRELENVLQRYATLGRIDFLEISETQPAEMMDVLPEFNNENEGLRGVLEEFEKKYLVRVLEQNHWHRGKTSAALKLPSKTLYRKMKKYQLL